MSTWKERASGPFTLTSVLETNCTLTGFEYEPSSCREAMREEAVAMACICKAGFARAVLVLLAVMALRIGPTDAVTNPNDTLALQAFKSTLLDPDLHLSNWKGNNPCEIGWTGVICSPPTGPSNITNVIELRLFQFNLGGSLAPELGNLSYLETLNVMWNNLTGSIPSSFGRLSNLQLLLLSGNQLSGILPPELGQLSKLDRIQIDQNQITGPIPPAFGGLRSIEHLHMSNNLLNGTIPKELGALPLLTHILLDNNALSGQLPSEIANATMLQIIQLDNNRFSENATIPTTWWNIKTLNKLSLRNCSIIGMIPDLGGLQTLNVLDLSHNNLTHEIPSTLPTNLTSLDLSNNQLTLKIPDSIGSLQHLEVLMVRNNQLSGSVPTNLGTAPTFNSSNFTSVIDFQNNTLDSSGQLANLVANSHTEVRFAGNPAVCPANMSSTASNPLCIPISKDVVQYDTPSETEYPSNTCFSCENITVGFRLLSPGFSLFDRYEAAFLSWISAGLNLTQRQVFLRPYMWQKGPQLALTILLFPDKNLTRFVDAEFDRLYNIFSQWLIPASEVFGPYELISFEPRSAQIVGATASKKGLSALVITAIVLGVAAFAVLVTSLLLTLVCRHRRTPTALRAQMSQLVRMAKAKKNPALKVAGVEFFTFKDLSKATNRFSMSNEIGEGGYGKVYQGTLAEKKQQVAIKRAQRESLQRANEFYTEIEFMSRCHHRNLVKLVGYCDDEGEQMLVYEYMAGGNLRQHLEFRKNGRAPLDFPTRLRIAIGSARGLLYLHTEADPPIIHRDIKANNILLNDLMVAKVADFGLSKQAPGPDTQGNIAKYISTGVKGTIGYIDPEYYLTHQLTEKSDVFSFGVVLLEIITGKRASKGNKYLLQEVQLREEAGQILTVVDPEVVHYPWGTLEQFMRLALRCCERLPVDRPNMAEVVRELEDLASSSSSSPDSYILDMSHPHEDVDPYNWSNENDQNSLHSVPATESERSDTVELLSKTVPFVKVR